ncbi:ABC transporter G family member 1-like [Andrographis paniculata]|uniref:ABC transporter G family member 1-like n=1 Tax=Andrographis paniculata TaxID=175694 RepID=UPI0021E95CA7|nr:ABC transporter G family member 1-like [Andrographis paniculata]
MKLDEESSPMPLILNKISPGLETPNFGVGIGSKAKTIFLTWKNVSVTVPDHKAEGKRRHILRGLTGYVAPGEVVAVMGPSGSGKSTLLDALAGRLDSNTNTTVTGDILVNGRKEPLAFGTSAYVTQDDTLMCTLTVREAMYYSAQLQLPDSMSKKDKKDRAEATIKDMGLQDAVDTRIGGWGAKGISGGEKRRLSIGIEILTNPNLLFLDEPTSGLDSASAYHVMNHIVKLAKHDNISFIAAIHQPSSEVFELFNNLCLLSGGRTVYFGSTMGANEFFASNGFVCPPMRNPSDHYLRTINKDFDMDVEQGFGDTKGSSSEATEILINAYQTSETFQQVQYYMNMISCQKNDGSRKKEKKKKIERAGFITQCLVLTRRSFVNMTRDLGYYWFRFGIFFLLNLSIGTLFYNVGHTYSSIQARSSALTFVSSFMTLMSVGGFPSFVEDMKIFSGERLNGHYSVAAFVVANTVSSIPYLLLVSAVPATLAYFLMGLQRSFDHFVYFILLLFLAMMLVEGIMMVVATFVPDYLTGVITGAGILGVMLLTGGFYCLPNDIPKPIWKYPIYYISYLKYTFQGFYKNEFLGLTFSNISGQSVITGEEIVKNMWQMETSYSKWIDMVILLAMIVVYRLMFLGILMVVEKLKPMIKGFLAWIKD